MFASLFQTFIRGRLKFRGKEIAAQQLETSYLKVEQAAKDLRQAREIMESVTLALEKKTRQLEAAFEVGKILNADIEKEEIVTRFFQVLERYFPGKRFSVLQYDREKELFDPILPLEVPGKGQVSGIPANEGGKSRLLQESLPIRITAPDEHFPSLPLWPDSCSAMVTSLVSMEELIGILLCESPAVEEFTREDENLLEMLAGQLAVSLRKIRLFGEVAYLKGYLEQLIEKANASIISVDTEGSIIMFNKASELGTGFSQEEVMGKDFIDLFVPEERQEAMRALFSQGVNGVVDLQDQYEVILRTKTGKIRNCIMTPAPIFSPEGKLSSFILVTIDITKMKELERQLIQADKLALLGQMAAGIAHELNNPLTGIAAYTEFSLREKEKEVGESKEIERLRKIYREVERLMSLSRNLMSYARPPEEDLVPLDINDVIEQSLSFSEYGVTRGEVKVIRELDPQVPKIFGIKSQLQQVMINLLMNAWQAIDHSNGEIIISTRSDMDELAVIEVKDNGVGINPENLPNIFEPFFSASSSGEGTGLGLSIVQSIVDRHQGKIDVRSTPGKGTSFTIRIPIEKSPNK